MTTLTQANGQAIYSVAGVSNFVHSFALDVYPYTPPRSAYNELFQSTLDKLIHSALHGQLFHGRQDEEGVAGRSMAWKVDQLSTSSALD